MKPMDDFIRDNLAFFDSDEPTEGHFERFYNKLQASRKTLNIRHYPMMLRIAAILIIVFFISTLLYKGVTLFTSFSPDESCLNSELCEAEDYYSKQVEKYYDQIKSMPFNNDPKTRMEVLKELREMDVQMVGMKEDLKQNPNDERIVYSIINYYQEKIDLMDMIIIRTTISKSPIL
jgi:hypothetical protein